MSEPSITDSLSEVAKTIIESWMEWKGAPKEAEELFRLFASRDESVLYVGRALYINSLKLLDNPGGTLFVTNSRLIFLASPNNNVFFRTKWVRIPLPSIASIQCVKHMIGYKIACFSGGREFAFKLSKGLRVLSKDETEAVMATIIDAQRNAQK